MVDGLGMDAEQTGTERLGPRVCVCMWCEWVRVDEGLRRNNYVT